MITALGRAALRRQGLALVLYLTLALVLTWPLVSHFTAYVPGDGIDDPALAWNLWWLKTRLVDQLATDIFHAGWMFHPVAINLAFYTLTPLNGLLSVPLQTAFSLVVANNLLVLASFVLAAFGAYLLAYDQLRWFAPRVTPRYLAALVAGVIYAFASSKLFYVSLGQFNIASSQWAPFCVLYLLRMVQASSPRARLRSAALAGLFLVFQAWAELTYASFLLIFAALLAVYALLLALWENRRAAGGQAAQLVLAFAVTGAVFLAGIAPILAAMLPDMRTEGDFFASGGGFADLFSADLFGYLVPTRLHPLLGDWVATLPFPNDKGQHIYVGYLAATLAVAGLAVALRRRDTRRWGAFWLVALVSFWLLTLGPQVRWLGEATSLPGPFALVSQLPFFSGNRYPSRYSIMLMLAVAVCASWGVAWVLARVPLRRAGLLAAAAGVLFLGEHLSAPLPLSSFAVPSLYASLAAAPLQEEGGVLLELPTGWRNGARVLGKSDLLIMYQQWYQSVHGQRRLGGNTSRNPEDKFQYFSEAPVLGDLVALMNADRPHIAAEVAANWEAIAARGRAMGGQVLDFLGVDYVTLHMAQAPPELVAYVETVLPLTLVETWEGVDWRGAAATIRLYRFDPPESPSAQQINLESAAGNLYLGAGWSPVATADGMRLAERAAPELLLDLPAAGATVRLAVDPAPVRATVNGVAAPVHTEGAAAVIEVRPGLASEPVDRVQLHFADAGLPARGLLVRSAGEEVGDFAHIYLDGREVSANARGYNLAAIGPDGALLAAAAFDTFASAEAADAMAAWLARWPAGTRIAGAVADEASTQLSQAAVDALRNVGVATDLRGRFRWSHAFIGAAGAAPGSALEQASLLAPATVFTGAPARSERIYGRLESITILP